LSGKVRENEFCKVVGTLEKERREGRERKKGNLLHHSRGG